jgi:hypothetical protein
MTDNTTPDTRTRFSIDLDDNHRFSLALIAKTFKITQGEVIETMLDQMGTPTGELAAAMTAKREAKVARRAPNKELYKQFKNMSADQLQAALDAAQKLQGAQAC